MSYLDYSPQKGLMFSILANASASAGDVKLHEQLEFETKYVLILGVGYEYNNNDMLYRATLGPLFDNSNHSDIPITHFLMSETAFVSSQYIHIQNNQGLMFSWK
jgi:hypothetical protein